MSELICSNNFDQHIFEPRYDEIEEYDKEVLDKGIKFYKEDSTAPMIDAKLKKKIYVCDICTRCGTKIERK